MDVSSGKQFSSRVDKCLDEIVILLSSYPVLTESKIELVLEEFFIVSAAVYDDWESSTGMNTGAEGREGQLCSRYENAAYALHNKTVGKMSQYDSSVVS
jgi:hypothetical protein